MKRDDPELEQVRHRLGDRLTVEAKLGQGGMGAVYRVIENGRTCALKVLMKSALADTASMRRFLLEGKVLAQLAHPNIIRLYELGEDPEFPYLLCEFVDGESLDVLVARDAPLPWDRALDLTDQVLEGLAAAHAMDVIHRDIKPSNLLLGKDGRLRLADFGIAKAQNVETKHTTTGMIVGTPAYIAPEVLRGEKPTPRSDIFSTGVMLYELLVGRLPWESTEAGKLLTERIMMTEAPAPTLRNPALPRSLDALVQMALAPRPVDRYPGAATFRSAIANARRQLVQSVGAPHLTAPISASGLKERTQVTRAGSGAIARPDAGEPPLPRVLRAAPPPPASRGPLLAAAILTFASVTIFSISRARPVQRATAATATAADLRGADPTEDEQKLATELRLDGAVQAAAIQEAGRTPRGVQLLYRAWRTSRRPALRDALAEADDPLSVPALVELMATTTLESARREAAAKHLRDRIGRALEQDVHPEALDARDELSTQLCDMLGREQSNLIPAVARAAIVALGWLRDPATPQHCVKFMALAQSADPEAQKLLERALARFQTGKAKDYAAEELRQLKRAP